MSTEQRVTAVEENLSVLTDCVRQLVDISKDMAGMMHRQQEVLDEVRAEGQMTRRLWVLLAQKHGWMDDIEWPPSPEG